MNAGKIDVTVQELRLKNNNNDNKRKHCTVQYKRIFWWEILALLIEPINVDALLCSLFALELTSKALDVVHIVLGP